MSISLKSKAGSVDRGTGRLAGILGLPAPAWASVVALFSTLPFLVASKADFVMLDDQENFLQNTSFQGLSWQHLGWAWRTDLLGVYQPLGWMILEVQYALFGLNPHAYHAVSLGLYALDAAFLFLLILAIVERAMPELAKDHRLSVRLAAALSVLLFSAHPLRAELVAWLSCQPYLPCALFAILSAYAYLKGHPRSKDARLGWLLASLCFYILSLLCKAAAVALPVGLILVDVAILRRLGGETGWSSPVAIRAWFEKVPYLVAGLVFAWRAKLAQRSASGDPLENFGPVFRGLKVAIAPGYYVFKTIFPVNLTTLYVYPRGNEWLALDRVLPLALSVLLTIAAIVYRTRRRNWALAWAFYLVALAPSLDLGRISNFFVADRYSYLPMFGLLAVACGCLSVVLANPRRAHLAVGACLIGYVVLGVMSWNQTATWRDSGTLWTHSLRVGSPHLQSRMQHNLAGWAAKKGRMEETLARLKEAIRIDPSFAQARTTLGEAYEHLDRQEEARSHYEAAIRLAPGDPAGHLALGKLLKSQAKLAEAVDEFKLAERLSPSDDKTTRLRIEAERELKALSAAPEELDPKEQARAEIFRGVTHTQQGRLEEAAESFRKVTKLDPTNFDGWSNMGLVLIQQKRPADAEPFFAKAVELAPKLASARHNWASVLILLGKREEGIAQLEKAAQLDPTDLNVRRELEQQLRNPLQNSNK